MPESLRVTEHDYEWHPKYLHIVVGLFCALYMMTTAVTPKIADFWGSALPAGIILFPLCCILTDLMTEVYGFNRTRQAIWTVLVCSVLFGLVAQITVWLPVAAFWPHQEAYAVIFGQTPRIAAAGCCAWVVGELLNTYVMSKMKILQHAKAMPVRFIASTVVGQLADSIVFSTVAFGGTMPAQALFGLILTAWVLKVGYEIVALPLSVPVARLMKRYEGVEHFDRQKLRLI